LKVENKVLSKIIVPRGRKKQAAVQNGMMKSSMIVLSAKIIRVVKSRTIIWVGHVARGGKNKFVQVSGGKLEGKRPGKT
jgi:hypothetical protein